MTVRYADPSDADDARAVQDAAGNDAASFTSAVRNDSDHTGAPGAPTGLEATANGPTRIDLVWRAPVERGDSDITGYRIEFSPDGVSNWRDLMEDTGERAVAYSDTRVVPAETRHYRVSAINGQGPGEPSEPADATTVSALPKIAGQPRVGATLRVETGDIGDLDGVDPATFAYRWIRIDGPVETEIRNATGETYELVEADAGKRVRVKVTFTDLADGGGNPEERASEAFPARGTVVENTPATGAAGDRGDGPGRRHAEGADRRHRRRRRAEQRRIQLPVGAPRRAGDPGRDRDRGDLHRGRGRPRQADPGRCRIHRRPRFARRAARERPGDDPGDERARVVPPARARGPAPGSGAAR